MKIKGNKEIPKKKEKVKINLLNKDGGSITLDAGMLPEDSRTMVVTVDKQQYVLNFEMIKCRLQKLGKKLANVSVEDNLKKVAETVAEQVNEMRDFAQQEKLGEGLFDSIYNFIVKYWTMFRENVINRCLRILELTGDAILAIIYRFFAWLFGYK